MTDPDSEQHMWRAMCWFVFQEGVCVELDQVMDT